MNLLMAMARCALVLDRARRFIDSPAHAGKLVTIEISSVDVQALHRCMVELIEERRRSAPFRAAKLGAWRTVDEDNRRASTFDPEPS